MASRFWAASDDSEDQTEEETEESEDESTDSDSSSNSGKGPNRFLVGDSDSESEDERRVIRSAKDKRYEELQAACDELRNKMHINDWASILSQFVKLNQAVEKLQKVLQQQVIPRRYIKALVDLEDFINRTFGDRDARKKMSTANAKSFSTMRQRLKKHNLQFKDQIDAFRANPESSEDEVLANALLVANALIPLLLPLRWRTVTRTATRAPAATKKPLASLRTKPNAPRTVC